MAGDVPINVLEMLHKAVQYLMNVPWFIFYY